MREASKTVGLLTAEERTYLQGRGIDIGCGNDPVRPDAERFDRDRGDANRITDYVKARTFDYVFSSHCLEHMVDPTGALLQWWALVRRGGVMVIVVPDEDLYEQGYWPSIFNADHKHTFRIGKDRSWSPVSTDLVKLVASLSGAEILSLREQHEGYDRAYLRALSWPRVVPRAVNAVRKRVAAFPRVRQSLDLLCLAARVPLDQTIGDAVAQNILIVRKRADGG